jgi:catechol 2,3-dioxygenase-like lactoylglutathione lyase family enzyme
MARIDRVLETSLYVADLKRSSTFYRDVLSLTLLLETRRLIAFDAGAGCVLLLFPRDAAIETITDLRGSIPGHGGAGRLHVAFAIPAADEQDWRARLARADIPITGEYRWPRGGLSLYFDDPDGHVIELATPGVWPTY